MLSPVDDVLDTLAELGIDRGHLVGASFGAPVAVDAALTRPRQVPSLLLSPPGGSLIAELTPDLRAFIETENATLARGDLGDAVEATLTWWVNGPRREAGQVDPTVRELVRLMQRRAFEVTAGWDDIEKRELDPAALHRLAEIRVPTLALVSSLDLEAIQEAARRMPTELLAHASSAGHTRPTCHRWNVPTTSSLYFVIGWPLSEPSCH